MPRLTSGWRRLSGPPRGRRYYRARYYHPGLQRFVSEDPIGFAGGDVNLYAYVLNAPLNFIDPTGAYIQSRIIPDYCWGGVPLIEETPELAGRKGPFARIMATALAVVDLLGKVTDCNPSIDLMPSVGMAKAPKAARAVFKGTDALRRHNKQAWDVAKKLKLTPDEARQLHDAISGQNIKGYREILELAREIFDR